MDVEPQPTHCQARKTQSGTEQVENAASAPPTERNSSGSGSGLRLAFEGSWSWTCEPVRVANRKSHGSIEHECL
jgi:hypothetical protein